MSWWIYAFGSALAAGATAILAKIGVRDVPSNLATAIRTVVILLFAWGIALAPGLPAFDKISGKTWLFLVLSGLATGASWLCYFRALKLGDASRVAPVDKLSVVVAMALAVAFLGERLSWQQWLAGLLIVSGALLLAYT